MHCGQSPRSQKNRRRPSATAILDRFLHHADILSITGRSYRLKDRAGKDAPGKGRGDKDEKDPPDGKDTCQEAVK